MLLLLLLGATAQARTGPRSALLMSGACPHPAAASQLVRVVQQRGHEVIPATLVASAVARVRAARALVQARRLFTRTSFAGCGALLSISEGELGRLLGDAQVDRAQHALRLLAEVNLWLGVCQWGAGDRGAAAASFVRSAQLPQSPLPDQRLLPPALLRDYQSAIAAPKEQISCALDASLRADQLLINGKGPTLRRDRVTLTAGVHYVVVRRDDTLQALRLEARPTGCVIRLPRKPPTAIACLSQSEGLDAAFVAAVGDAAGAAQAVVLTLEGAHVALRIAESRRAAFARQISTLAGSEPVAVVAGRSLALLLGQADEREPRSEGQRTPWYRRVWIWTTIGAAVLVGTVSAVAAATRTQTVKVVFER